MRDRHGRMRRHAAPHASHERWVVSYADFITLLFAFFTTMYAISTVDARKLSRMVDSMQAAFDSQTGTPTDRAARPRTGGVPVPPAVATAQREQALVRRLRDRLDDATVDVELDHRGIVVSMREAGSFTTGSAELSDVARGVLGELAAVLSSDDSLKLRVEGHTDDVPIQTGRFASNWELSTARATAVVTFLVEQPGLAPQRLSAAGYGEFHPRVPNDSDEDRARNRRVDIVILDDANAAEEPSTRHAGG